MANTDLSESPLDRAAGAAGPHATQAFALLSNETRLAILLALWEAHEPHTAEGVVPFSDLRDRVGTPDSGQFNYHLGQLENRFIRKTEDGYVLRRSGLKLIQSIISGTGIEEPTLERTRIDASCKFCGSTTEITYKNGYVYQVCSECSGIAEMGDGHPQGVISGWTFEPTGNQGRSAEEVFTASSIKNYARIAMRFEEICPECSGPVEWSMELCDNHQASSDEPCSNCGRERPVVVRETCTVCKSSGQGSPGIKVLFHPAVVAFYYDHGIEIGFTGDTTFQDVIRTLDLVESFDEEVVSMDPPRIRITVSHQNDELSLLLDENMTVLGVDAEE